MKKLLIVLHALLLAGNTYAMSDDQSMTDFYECQDKYLANYDEQTLIDTLNSYIIQLEPPIIPDSTSAAILKKAVPTIQTPKKKDSKYNTEPFVPFIPQSQRSRELYFDIPNNQCKACGHKCADWSSLNVHCVRNHAVKRFSCEYCAQLKKVCAFAYKGDLTQHLKNVHKYITL